MSAHRSPYEVLGLRQGAGIQEIKETYRRLCLQHHPDLCPADRKAAAENFFKEITAAYTLLLRNSSRNRWGGYHSSSASGPTKYSAAAARAAPRYSNGVVGAVIAAPLVLLGLWLYHKSSNVTYDSVAHPRPYGLLHPPVNPYLKEEYRPRTYSRFSFNGWVPRRVGQVPQSGPAASGRGPGG